MMRGSPAPIRLTMDDSQIHIPDSFVRLFVRPGRTVPRHRAAEIAQRFEICDDMAAALVPRAQALQFGLGITEADVLDKLLESLLALAAPGADGAPGTLTRPEAHWVVCHLAEQLGWLDHLSPALLAALAEASS
jgi:hypothetical protein